LDRRLATQIGSYLAPLAVYRVAADAALIEEYLAALLRAAC
jgi:hypothetical protein